MADSRKPSIDLSPAALADLLFRRLGLDAGTRFHVAFSGGLDSTVLLHLLVQLRAQTPLRLGAIHVHHGLQPTADAWATYCAQLCGQWEVPCAIERIEVDRASGQGIEAAARTARYAALQTHIATGDVLLTAHQQDDQAETVLLQLLRGTGVPGLAAMPALAPFDAGYLARPLLAFSRTALNAYARAHALAWIEDESNRDPRQARNVLRHRVLPLVRAHWPQAAEAMARTATHAVDAAAVLDEVGRADWQRVAAPDMTGALSIPELLTLSPARQRNVIRCWLRAERGLAPSAAHLDEILSHVARRPRSGHARVCWPGAEVHRYRDHLYVLAPLRAVPAEFDVAWDLAAPLPLPSLGCRIEPIPAVGRGLSPARVRAPLRLRLRQGGEICRLRGHRHTLKQLLQEQGVPPWRRARLPLLYSGEELAAVGDLWVCEPYQARANEPGLILALRAM